MLHFIPIIILVEWSPWSEWGQCSVTCRLGQKRRSRTCIGGIPGRDCIGNSTLTDICLINPECPCKFLFFISVRDYSLYLNS